MNVVPMSRRNFMKAAVVTILAIALASTTGCSGTSEDAASSAPDDTITMVWLPDNCSADLAASREAFGDAIEEASGCQVELMTTTDYNVAIEAIASGNAQIAFLGAEAYIQANAKNPAVQCACVQSDAEGGLDGACYYSRICVRKEDAAKYKDGSGYSLANLKGKSFSFVSATSTSGFKIPSASIVEEFGLESSDELLDGGDVFSEVLYGNSHAGSCVNLLSGDADAAAFDDVDVDMYLELVEGEPNAVGSVYKARQDAEAPMDSVAGEEFVVIGATPVLNSPICFNTDTISEVTRAAITEVFCSSEFASNPDLFADPDDENSSALFDKESEKSCLVEVTDEWFDPIRELQ